MNGFSTAARARLRRLVLAAALVGFAMASPTALAQGFTGPDRCLKCHKRLAGPAWKLHRESGAQLDPAKKPNAAVYAAATGGNPKAEACRKCHAPDVASSPATVSCETCHGPGKEYNDPHQERAFYDGPNLMGLVMLYEQAGRIAELCTRCHVLGAEHKAIVDLGHPTGDTFKVGAAFEKIKHWPSGQEKDVRPRAYAAAFLAQIDRAAAPRLAKALKATRPPAPARAPAAGAARPAGARPATPTAAAPAGGVLAALLDDLREEGVEVRTSNLADEAPAAFVPPAPPAPTQARAGAPPSTGSGAAAPEAAPPVPSAANAQAPAARDVFELRGQAAARLAALLRAKRKLEIPAPAPPARFAGPDSELLVLQDEVLALALEALRKQDAAKNP